MFIPKLVYEISKADYCDTPSCLCRGRDFYENID